MDSGPGTLQCRLLDRRSSIPLANARVTCVWRDQKMSVFQGDGLGNYESELPQGVYDLLVSAQGYFSLLLRGIGVLGGHTEHMIRGLIPGDAHDREPEGTPSTAVGGYVVDRLDRPIQGVIVQANEVTAGLKNFGTSTGYAYTARTDANGAYILHGVVPATYDIAFRVGDHAAHQDRIEITSLREFVRADAKLVNLAF